MAKIAVGARVRRTSNNWATIHEVDGHAFRVSWDIGGANDIWWNESDFVFDAPDDPRAPKGPVRTVERKEIVPGVYGRVGVTGCISHGESVPAVGLEFVSRAAIPAAEVDLTADELDSAAAVFTQLAEALRSSEG